MRAFAIFLATAVLALSPVRSDPGDIGDAGVPVREQGPSIVFGEWTRTRILGIHRCSEEPDAICVDVVAEGRFEVGETVAGPNVPSPLTVRFVTHVMPRQGNRGWLLVQPGKEGSWWPSMRLGGVDLERPGEVCVNPAELQAFGLASPSGGRIRGDDRCFRY